MNQILSTQNINNSGNKKNRGGSSSGAKDINSVLKFFAIMLIIFGVLIVGNGVLALTGGNNKEKVPVASKPQIMLETKDDDKVLISVMDEIDIDNVTYYWNDEDDEQSIQGASGKMVQKVVDIPDGENILYVRALNVEGEAEEMSKKFKSQATISTDISISGNNIKINVNSKDNIETISYAWDDEDEQEIEVGDTSYSMQLEAMIGEHTLKVTITDINGVKKVEEQKVTGTTKPRVEITKGKGAYHIAAYDDIGLSRIEITTLSDGMVTRIDAEGKEFEYDYPIIDGEENYIKVVAINTNKVSSKAVKAKLQIKAQE